MDKKCKVECGCEFDADEAIEVHREIVGEGVDREIWVSFVFKIFDDKQRESLKLGRHPDGRYVVALRHDTIHIAAEQVTEQLAKDMDMPISHGLMKETD